MRVSGGEWEVSVVYDAAGVEGERGGVGRCGWDGVGRVGADGSGRGYGDVVEAVGGGVCIREGGGVVTGGVAGRGYLRTMRCVLWPEGCNRNDSITLVYR